mmetsp:Transcript_4956/g.17964  ORF Transcript_4956/g.17964 Transcript_4956/m.17964 type:complete len:223 (-) Transcript_4956:705-1373(-)
MDISFSHRERSSRRHAVRCRRSGTGARRHSVGSPRCANGLPPPRCRPGTMRWPRVRRSRCARLPGKCPGRWLPAQSAARASPHRRARRPRAARCPRGRSARAQRPPRARAARHRPGSPHACWAAPQGSDAVAPSRTWNSTQGSSAAAARATLSASGVALLSQRAKPPSEWKFHSVGASTRHASTRASAGSRLPGSSRTQCTSKPRAISLQAMPSPSPSARAP